jgi:putative acetyltransferase
MSLTPSTSSSTSFTVGRADFTDPALAAFLQAHLDEMEPTAPAESRHALDLEQLQQQHVRVWVAYDDAILGTGALARIEPGHEEVKSMRTDPASRGRGVARTLLGSMVDDAVVRGVRRISLETGSMGFFAPARALYASVGFVDCGPFGSYAADPHSVYMTLELPELAA